MIEPLIEQFSVDCGLEAAFALWTEHTTLWWPKSHKLTGDPNAAVLIEARIGGRIYERASDGRELDWGEVQLWEPPGLLAYLWHIGVDRRAATQVEIRFSSLDAQTTKVRIVHSGWERLGDKGQSWRDRNARGWSGVLPLYREACGNSEYVAAVRAVGRSKA